MTSLFDSGHEPLALRLAPPDLEAFFGQNRHLGKDGALRRLIERDRLPSAIFYGPPGCGKTALAHIVARRTESSVMHLNGVTAKTEDLRRAIHRAENNLLAGQRTVIIIDEIHRFNRMVQDGLLPVLEQGSAVIIGTTTKNPFSSLIPPLRSRLLIFEFDRLGKEDLSAILEKAVRSTGVAIEEDAKDLLVGHAGGDARRMLNVYDAASALESDTVGVKSIERILQKSALLYDRDESYHYDVISAFIKSVRGSDPDASVYWLTLMLEGGEDPLFIARRLVILASEDIGLADPLSLVIAESAYEAVERIGMPEGAIVLSHATLYLSLQPKSNSSYQALGRAREFVKNRGNLDVPGPLRSLHPDAKKYVYPHDLPYHFVDQDYLPERVELYIPGELGAERELKKRLEFLRKLREEGDRP
jgi:putative ATPase